MSPQVRLIIFMAILFGVASIIGHALTAIGIIR